MEQGFDDATAVMSIPEKYRKRLRTTNSQERLNEEVRRRERVIRIFPNRDSAYWDLTMVKTELYQFMVARGLNDSLLLWICCRKRTCRFRIAQSLALMCRSSSN